MAPEEARSKEKKQKQKHRARDRRLAELAQHLDLDDHDESDKHFVGGQGQNLARPTYTRALASANEGHARTADVVVHCSLLSFADVEEVAHASSDRFTGRLFVIDASRALNAKFNHLYA